MCKRPVRVDVREPGVARQATRDWKRVGGFMYECWVCGGRVLSAVSTDTHFCVVLSMTVLTCGGVGCALTRCHVVNLDSKHHDLVVLRRSVVCVSLVQ